jgi:hypothetical protein
MYRKRLCVLALGVAFVLACGTAASAKVLFEYWLDIGGTSIDNDLRTQCSFPDGPSQSELRDNLKSLVDWKDNYGLRARAYLTPPADGDYTFWVSGDDNCQLWLSTDDSAANAALIAQVAGWTPVETWDWEAGQKSAPIALKAGQKYYVEMLVKEGGGGDSVTAAWGGPTIGAGPVVIGAEFLTEFVRTDFPAFCPNPADGKVDWVTPLLQWKGAANAQMHNIFFGTTPDLTAANMAGMMPGPAPLFPVTTAMTPGTTYYWRVDEVAAAGTSTGNVWSFTVMPLKAHFPSPADGAKWRAASTKLSWTAGQNVLTHDVYFGTDQALVAVGDASVAVAAGQEVTSFDPCDLTPNTTYYWRVDEHDATGNLVVGDVWSFSSFDPNGGAVAEYWAKMFKSEPAFVGAPDVVKTVPEINFDWGDGPTTGVNSPDPAIPTNLFSCRWTAELNVPVTGTYRLYEASDDGARMYLNGEKVAEGWWDRGTTEDATGPLELVAGERYQIVMEMYENGGGATAFLRWSGPGIAKEIIPQGAIMPPQGAFSLSPSNGSVDVDGLPVLSWLAGDKAVRFNVYLSKNEALVAASDPNVLLVQQSETSFTPAEPLGRGTTNFWKVDAVLADGTVIPGLVSSFRIADENTKNWVIGVTAAEPNYLATFVQDGLYDIGTFSGDMTYELIVRSNPDEKEASMCLIGVGVPGVKGGMGLKYEQWSDTGGTRTYGATVFGVMDYDYGVPTAPGEYTHLVFVANKAAGTTDLYVNGELKGSVPAAITLSGPVGIGYACKPDGSGVFDNFDGDIFGVAIYGKALSAEEIAKHADMYFSPIPIADPDLLIYYDFESGSGRTAVDQSGHGNHGRFMGNPEWTRGMFGGCLSLDIARLDYVQTAAPLGIVSNHVTVMGWVRHDQTPAGWSGILTHRGSGCLGLQHNGSEGPLGAELRYMWGADQYWDFSSGLLIPNGEWYFAALAISPTQAKFYLNGVDQTATNVAEHVPVIFDSLIRVGRDHQDSRIMTCLIDEVRFYNRTLTDADIQRLLLSDVTAPGDAVQGVPNDGDWPGAETPDKVIDNSSSTKFLHFKGELLPTGIQVTPAVGSTIVTGLTFTTANDSPGRDPVTFELSGSNDGIDGSWTVIAAGDIVDFAQATEWPRFTMNATAISFENAVAYQHYQIVFPALRNPVTDPMMQIAEIELLGSPAPLFVDDFESYVAGSAMHGQGGWKGWAGDANAGAPASSTVANSGAISVEILKSSDLVHEFAAAGGKWIFSLMQYCPSGTSGKTMCILMNQYNDPGTGLDWSVQDEFDLGAGVIGGTTTPLVFDKWVELQYIIDLDKNTVDKYYDGKFFGTQQWDDNVHGTFQAVDLYGNNASSVYYDDVSLVAY